MENKTDNRENELGVTVVGGPTALLELGGLRLLTDPTFDPPGHYLDERLSKFAGPVLTPDELDPIDVVLLSHDQHLDNLDVAGRALLGRVPQVLTTPGGATRLGAPVRGLEPWESVELARPNGTTLRVTGTPAQHGPEDVDRDMDAEVTGFVLSAPDLPTVYVSGDNAAPSVVAEIVRRLGVPDHAVLFVGAARSPVIAGGRPLTLTSAAAVEVAGILGEARIVPVHMEGWRHFSEGAFVLRKAFADAGLLDRLLLPLPGERVVLQELLGTAG